MPQLLLLFQTALLLAARPACPDLSGRFVIQGEDGRAFITIAQQQCQSVQIDWAITYLGDTSRSTHSFRLDNEFRRDVGWFGAKGQQLTAVQLHDSALVITAKPLNASDSVSGSWRLVLRLLPDGDLCTREYRSADRFAPMTGTLAARARRPGKEGVDDAASRAIEVSCGG